MDIISPHFRTVFRDYCSGNMILREINDMFEGSGIEEGQLSPDKAEKISGQRRTLVESYFASIDWEKIEEVNKFLKVLKIFFTMYVTTEDHPLRALIRNEGFILEGNNLSFPPGIKTSGGIKYLIFAANGPKPQIAIIDTLNNTIKIVQNQEFCLVYDHPIFNNGLLWKDMLNWWKEKQGHDSSKDSLYKRLHDSLDSPPEKLLFDTYTKFYSSDNMPALIPQVYLHYDPYTARQLDGIKNLERQRMDFLMLLPNNIRVVIEVDGKQHYSEERRSERDSFPLHIASPKKYAEMVSEDRRLKLTGYDLYRFGGLELQDSNGINIVKNFFDALFQRYNINVVDEKL